MKLIYLLIAFVLFIETPTASAVDWKSSVVLVAGQTAAALTHERFLHNGSNCTDVNALYAQHPTITAVLIPVIIIEAASIVAHIAQKPTPSRFARALNYSLGAVGGVQAMQNVHRCGR